MTQKIRTTENGKTFDKNKTTYLCTNMTSQSIRYKKLFKHEKGPFIMWHVTRMENERSTWTTISEEKAKKFAAKHMLDKKFNEVFGEIETDI